VTGAPLGDDVPGVKRKSQAMKLFRGKPKNREEADDGLGLFLFDDVSSALRAEKVLKGGGYDAKLVAPPANLRAGCDLAVALPRVEYPGAVRALGAHRADFKEWADTEAGSAVLADLVTTVDFGDWIMVRAANMKMTIEKSSGRIINTSGGGCPDIPYLNLELVGKKIEEAPSPRDLGFTLCGLMLDRAYRECKEWVDRQGDA